MSLRRLTTHILKKQHVNSVTCSSIRCTNKLTDNDATKNLNVTLMGKASSLFNQGREIAHTFKNGFKELLGDSFRLMKVMNRTKEFGDGYRMTLEEIELVYEFRLELRRLFPVLFFGVLPFGNCIAIPMVIKFPRKFLSHHFWTEEQKQEFSQLDHITRVNMYLPVISELHNADAFERCPKWRKILDTVNCGKTPSYPELLSCVDLFTGTMMPLSLDRMDSTLQTKLMKMHNMTITLFKFNRLFCHGSYILFADHRIRTNGGAHTLPFWRLKKYCFLRGINAHEMAEKEMQEWLNQWTNFTKKMTPENMALFLIAPALVTLNHPSNASLLFNSN